jgi:serine/threonine protein kinase
MNHGENVGEEMRVPQASASAPSGPSPDDPRVVAALEEYVAALQAGQAPDRKAFQQRHPAIAEILAECLEGLDWMRGVVPGFRPAVAPGTPLGDFRIVREIGRGGMGVVYEAEQLSLGRPVALKVLPFAAAMDAKQLQRFKTEAYAAAQLHHTNIVPVYGVGCERGVHFYAMQYVEGQTVAAVIVAQRKLAGGSPRSDDATTPYLGADAAPAPNVARPPDVTRVTDTTQPAALSTPRSPKGAAYFRTVANLGIQAAEALEHAHQRGIIHRDIKPGNLLVETTSIDRERETGGEALRLWITDFGLAHCRNLAGLSIAGDLIGTLRYMSPEQALANPGTVDQRTDIYSLGTTLYELLTLQPVFAGNDRQQLLRQIAFEEPVPPRKLDKLIPVELETIVLKAMEKNPGDRYATAQDLADDLQRFLDDKPIRARRPTVTQRAAKWVRRHKAMAWMGVGLLAVLAVGSSVSALIIADQRNLAEQRRLDAEQERAAAQQAQKGAGAERDKAKRAEAKAEAINQFMVQRMLTFGNPGMFGYRDSDTTVADVLHEAGRSVAGAFPGQPELEASVRLTLGNTFFRMGMFTEAEQHLRRGLDLQGDLLADSADASGREYAETVFATKKLGLALQALGRPAEAEPFLRRSAQARRQTEIRRIPWRVNAYPYSINVLSVAFSPDSRWLLAGGDENCMRLYDVATGVEVHRFVGHAGYVQSVAFSPDGRRILSGAQDKTVRLWDAATATELRRFTGLGEAVSSVAFSTDGRLALSASGDKTIRVWEVETGDEVGRLQGHTATVQQAVFSPDTRWVLSIAEDGTMRLWERETGKEVRRSTGGAASHWFAAVAFSPDGRTAASLQDGYEVRLWDVTTGTEIRRFADAASGCASVAFTPDGNRIFSTNQTRGKLHLWDVRTGTELKRFHSETPLSPQRGVVSPDGRLGACGYWRGAISIWRLSDPPPLGQEVAQTRRTLESKRRDLGPDHPETLRALDELAAVLSDERSLGEAEPLLRESLRIKQRLHGAETTSSLAAMKNLAGVLGAQGKWAESEVFRRQCLEVYARAQGPQHPDVVLAMNDLAAALEARDKRDEADVLYAKCAAAWYRLLHPYHPETQAALRTLFARLEASGKPLAPELVGPVAGHVYAEMGKWDKALACIAKAFERDLPKEDWLWFDYGCLLLQQGDVDGYRKLCSRLLERHDQGKIDADFVLLARLCLLAPLARADGGRMVEFVQRRIANVAPDGRTAHVLALAYYRAGEYEKAALCLRKVLKPRPDAEYDVANCLLLAMAERRLGHDGDALVWYDKADAWIQRKSASMPPQANLAAPRVVVWRDWLAIQFLHREAAPLIRAKINEPEQQYKIEKPAGK